MSNMKGEGDSSDPVLLCVDTQRCTQRQSDLNIHPTYSDPHPQCAYVSLSVQRNVTEDPISSRDDVTAAYRCVQAALGERRQALPSGHSLAQTLKQGTMDPIDLDCTQLCKLHTGH